VRADGRCDGDEQPAAEHDGGCYGGSDEHREDRRHVASFDAGGRFLEPTSHVGATAGSGAARPTTYAADASVTTPMNTSSTR